MKTVLIAIKKFLKVYVFVVCSLFFLTIASFYLKIYTLNTLAGSYTYITAPTLLASVEHLFNKSFLFIGNCRVVNISSQSGILLFGEFENPENLFVQMHVRNLMQHDYACPQCTPMKITMKIEYSDFRIRRIEYSEISFRNILAFLYTMQALNTKRMLSSL